MRLAVLFALLIAAAAGSAAAGERKLIVERESLYNNIYIYSNPPYLNLSFGHNGRLYTETVFNTKDERDLPVVYTRYMTAGLIYSKKVKSVLEIGAGGGRTAWYLHLFLPEVPVTSVELDPTVVELAKKHFGIREEPNFRLVTRDGRLFLREDKGRYDVIMIDAYRGPFVPFHLLTKEFYQAIKAHLAEGGVVVQNIEPTTMLFDSAALTLKSVFDQVEFYLAKGNVVSVAYDGPQRTLEELTTAAEDRQAKFKLRYPLPAMLAQRRLASEEAGTISDDAKVLTDDFAPVESLKAIETHNRKWAAP